MKKAFALAALALTLMGAHRSYAVPTLSAMTTFGGGDGWRAPKEIVTGDAAGTTTGSDYTYLSVNSGERGFAYNPVTGNLVLVSRPSVGAVTAGAAPFVRVLNGATGSDLGGFNMTGVATGGAGILNKVGVSTDGAIYAANVTTNIGANVFKIYKWNSEATGTTAPTTVFNGTVSGFSGTPRVGDTFDVTGSSAAPIFVAGGSGSPGYAVISGGVGTSINSILPNTSPAGPTTSDFSRGITFTDSANSVWGKGIGNQTVLWETTYTTSPAAGTRTAAPTFNGNQAPMDYITIQGVPYLAVVDYGAAAGTTSAANRPNVFIYNVSNPAAPLLVVSGSAVPTGITVTAAAGAGPIAAAGGGGQVAWGATTYVNDQPLTTLYAMATNQGIQAFNFQVDSVPEASSFLALGVAGLVAGGGAWYRRQRRAA